MERPSQNPDNNTEDSGHPSFLHSSTSSNTSINSFGNSNNKRFSSSTVTSSQRLLSQLQTQSQPTSPLERSLISSASCQTPSASHFNPTSQPFNTPESSFEFDTQDESMQHIKEKIKALRLRSPGGGESVGKSSPSSLLHDMLKERKASGRVSKVYADKARRRSGRDDGLLDLSGSTEVNKNSQNSLSPLAHKGGDEERKDQRRASGIGNPRGMGIREMDEHVQKLSKQNFNLKLEIVHHRQRAAALEEKLERAEAVQRANTALRKEYVVVKKENTELKEFNEQLVYELEIRDKAVQEAVNLICELEAKVEQLEEDAQASKEMAAIPEDDDMSPPNDQKSNMTTPSTPARRRKSASKTGLSNGGHARTGTPVSLHRTPSFLTGGDKKSTSALRSLYLDGDNQYSMLSLASRTSGLSLYGVYGKQESPEYEESMNSPRLSVLSESSFLSVYGDNRPLSLAMRRQDTEKKNSEEEEEEGRKEQTAPEGARDVGPATAGQTIREVPAEEDGEEDIWAEYTPTRMSRRSSRSTRVEQWVQKDTSSVPSLLTPDTTSTVETKKSKSSLASVITEKSCSDSWDAESLQVEESVWDDDLQSEIDRLTFFSPASPGVVRRMVRQNTGYPRDMLFSRNTSIDDLAVSTPTRCVAPRAGAAVPGGAASSSSSAPNTPAAFYTPASTIRRPGPGEFYTPPTSFRAPERKSSIRAVSALSAPKTPRVPGAWAETPVKKAGFRSRLFRRG